MEQTAVIQQMIVGWLMPSFLSAVAAFLLGIVWYHPRVLGSKWLEARGKTSEDMVRNASPFVLSFPLWALLTR